MGTIQSKSDQFEATFIVVPWFRMTSLVIVTIPMIR
jgi:hypothetical protein